MKYALKGNKQMYYAGIGYYLINVAAAVSETSGGFKWLSVTKVEAACYVYRRKGAITTTTSNGALEMSHAIIRGAHEGKDYYKAVDKVLECKRVIHDTIRNL
eukprot:GHVS01083108.1.p1 GENE.GHVS01083108.1~~GHVS01083108.1.p1  ORF type:complete len:102 (+),score=17.38 GHVS01083108.1:253-558(+)